VLGQRVAELEGGPAGVTLRIPDQPPTRAPDSESLLASAFGWSAPLEGLRYWVMGLSQPFAPEPEGVSLDARGRLLGLEQAGWRLDIAQYTSADGLELPKRLTLSHARARVRLIIDEWTIEHAPGGG
jgi:outer membrane lipoprotein LolB